MKKKRTLTTGEIAEYCDVNLRTVLRWIQNGHLKAYRLPGGGDNRVEVADFIVFLRENQMPVPKDFLEVEKRILIVDDDMMTCRMIEGSLQKHGFETQIATTGFQAGLYLESFAPHLITLDLMMPGIDGYQVMAWIRGSEAYKDIKNPGHFRRRRR